MTNDLSTDGPPRQFFNPERIGSFSPRFARFEEGLPWVAAVVSGYPERVGYHGLARRRCNPFRVVIFLTSLPGVARSLRTATSRNPRLIASIPLGLGKAGVPPVPSGIPPKTARNHAAGSASLCRRQRRRAKAGSARRRPGEFDQIGANLTKFDPKSWKRSESRAEPARRRVGAGRNPVRLIEPG